MNPSNAASRRPAWMDDPDTARERDNEEWARICQEWEDTADRRENVRLGFEEPRK